MRNTLCLIDVPVSLESNMQYVFGIWMIGVVVLGVRAQRFRNMLIGYLRSYYSDVPNWIQWSWSPWFITNRLLGRYCEEHSVEDPQLNQLRQETGRGLLYFYVWGLSLPILFGLFPVLVFFFSP